MFSIMKSSIIGIIQLIRFIVPQLLFCCGEKPLLQKPKINSKKFITIHQFTQEDVLNLNSLNPKELMMLKSNIFKVIKNGNKDNVKGPYTTKHYDENVTANVPQTSPLQKVPELEAVNSNPQISESSKRIDNDLELNSSNNFKPTQRKHWKEETDHMEKQYVNTEAFDPKKKYLKLQYVDINFKPIQKSHLMEEKDKKNYVPPLNHTENQYVIVDDINIESIQNSNLREEKEQINYVPPLNPTEKPYVSTVAIKPIKNNLNFRFTRSDTKSLLNYNDKYYQPRVLEENKGRILKSSKVSPINTDRSSAYHRHLNVGKDTEQRKWNKDILGSQTNQRIYEPAFRHNYLQSRIEEPSKQNDTRDPSSILPFSDSFNRIPSSKTKSSGSENFFQSTYNPLMQVGEDYQVQNSGMAVASQEVPASFKEKIPEVNFPGIYNRGQKGTNKHSDINDVIQVDLFDDFQYKTPNRTEKETRPKKNVEVPEKKETPWKTIDMLLAGFAILTVFVMVTICMVFSSISRHAEDMEDGYEQLGCWGRARKKFVLGVGFLGVYLVTCLNFALEELDDPENPTPQSNAKRKIKMGKKPLIEPVTSAQENKRKKIARVTFDSHKPSSSETHPASNTSSIHKTTTSSQSGPSSLGQPSSYNPSRKMPSLPTVPSSRSPDSLVRQVKSDPFNIPSSKVIPSETTVPATTSPFLPTPDDPGTVNITESFQELPSLPTVPSTSSEIINRQSRTVAANTKNLNNNRNCNDDSPKWINYRKRPS